MLSKVRRSIQDGWDNTVRAHKEFKSYYEKRNELTMEHVCVLWGASVVVPTKLRRDVLKLIHSTHQGVVAMKGLARSYCWWSKITADIEEVSRSCEACVTSLKNPTKTTPWIPATKPWERIHLDFAGPFQNKMWMIVVDAYSKWMIVVDAYSKWMIVVDAYSKWMIVVDAYSKWMIVVDMRSRTTSSSVITKLRQIFSRWGLCRTYVTDIGPHLTSDEMAQFFASNGITHFRVPVYSPWANGQNRIVCWFLQGCYKAHVKVGYRHCNISGEVLSEHTSQYHLYCCLAEWPIDSDFT